MTKLNDEYDALLKYIERHKSSEIEEPRKIEEAPAISKDKPSPNTLDFSALKSLVPNPVKIANLSDGFNVERYEILLRTKLNEQNKKSLDYNSPYLSVTSILGCLRRYYYQKKHYEIEWEKHFTYPYLDIICQVGNLVHDYMQTIYGFDEVEKVLISKKYNVKGKVDGIHNRYVIEIKTIDESKFEDTYLELHYLQACIYSYLLNEEFDYNIDKIDIVYVLRSLKAPIVFTVEPNDILAKSYLDKTLFLSKALNDNEVCDPYNAELDDCEYCHYKKYCEKDATKKVTRPFRKRASKPNIKENKPSEKKVTKSKFLL